MFTAYGAEDKFEKIRPRIKHSALTTITVTNSSTLLPIAGKLMLIMSSLVISTHVINSIV